LRAMEDGSRVIAGPRPSSKRGAEGLFPAALTVPRLRAEFETLYRDRKVAEATLVFSLERLESARADEARDTSTFLVLDPPFLPTRKSRPHRFLIVFLSTFLALGIAFATEWWRVFGSASVFAILGADVVAPDHEERGASAAA